MSSDLNKAFSLLAPAKEDKRKEKASYLKIDKEIVLGIPAAQINLLAKEFRETDLNEIKELALSSTHEKKMLAAKILDLKAKRAKTKSESQRLFEFYIDLIDAWNNWDLIDCSAPSLVGKYLFNYSTKRKAARMFSSMQDSNIFWHNRAAILAGFYFIRQQDYLLSFYLAERELLKTKDRKAIPDLIQKPHGWMLREIGKRSQKDLEEFLERYAAVMPSTMLSYSLEKFSPDKRKYYRGLRSV